MLKFATRITRIGTNYGNRLEAHKIYDYKTLFKIQNLRLETGDN